ncbi:response regulator transcription factor [Hazenella sp. IB182357]|uniref:Response regulator transcription factor n=1 Tax=Polycladospora coralii TaxID=2771432 RepID=A0A926NA97_9BACL|nr:response regulator transcription factor [Polycladospora coralii]MBD1372787.1 response regulator transcription factor [Polycladospora coralii]MBS7529515.1 response regulator transcription factor [Polycladospora coralii]
MGKRILVVDDEQSIVKLLKFNLEKEGYDVEVAYDGQVAIDKLQYLSVDLLILDLMLPKMDGLEVCRRIRQGKKHLPILMLTAKAEEFDKVLGLELGADDYMTKPFSPRELTARVKAILRRVEAAQVKEEISDGTKNMHIGNMNIDIEGYVIYRDDEEIDLTPKEFELMVYMANHRGKVLSRDQLLNAVWNYDYVGDSRIVDVHVSHLRDKIEEDTRNPVFIKTVRGIGYKFEGPKE